MEGGADLMSADMKRELQRQEWEREAEEAMKGPVGPTHYANVQRNGRFRNESLCRECSNTDT